MKLIVNTDINWGIGRDGGLLFSNKEDMRFFRQTTTGGAVVMGRKTLESFPGKKPLKDRINIVMTRDTSYTAEGAVICHTKKELAAACDDAAKSVGEDKVFLIGGGSMYDEFAGCCSGAYVTRTYADGDADCFMQPLDSRPGWREVNAGELLTAGDGVQFRFAEYVNEDVKEIEDA